jgi:hypothetical protein
MKQSLEYNDIRNHFVVEVTRQRFTAIFPCDSFYLLILIRFKVQLL